MRIGVVIPAHNAAATVARAVRSVLAQTPPPAWLLVVDDGSRDDTALRAAEAGAYVLRQSNAGAAAARHAGVQWKDADAAAFLDADDEMAPGHLTACKRALEQHPNASLVFGLSVELRDDGSVRHVPGYAPADLRDPIWALAWRNLVPTSATVVPTWAYRRSGGFDPGFATAAEDYDLWLRLAQLGELVGTGALGVRRHVSARSNSRRENALDPMRDTALRVVQHNRPGLPPWFGRVAAAHVLREAAKRSLAGGLVLRARHEARRALRCNPTDVESWEMLALTTLPGPVRTGVLGVHSSRAAANAANTQGGG